MRQHQEHSFSPEPHFINTEPGRINEPVLIKNEAVASAAFPGLICFRVEKFKKLVCGILPNVREASARKDVQRFVLDSFRCQIAKIVSPIVDGEMNFQKILFRISSQFFKQTVKCQQFRARHVAAAPEHELRAFVVATWPEFRLPFLVVVPVNCTNLTGVVIPGGVTSIGNYAFYYCSTLATATIPASLTNLGDSAFYNCSSLTSAITLGDSLGYLGNFAFAYCAGLASFTVGNGITSVGNSVFLNCIGLTNISLGTNVTSIGSSAFYYCNSLTSFTIPAGVTNIGNYAFYYCTKLSAITIPNGVTSIGVSVFQNCSALKRVVLPAAVTSIGYNAFYYSGLTNVIIPAGVSSIGLNAFCYCTSLKTVFFQGNAPATVNASSFMYAPVSTVFALPGTTGWPAFTATTGLSVTAWLLPYPTILNFEPNFGIQTNSFGFTISWATNAVVVVVEASTKLQNWTPVSTNTLTGGWLFFSDPGWTNHPARFYRIRSP